MTTDEPVTIVDKRGSNHVPGKAIDRVAVGALAPAPGPDATMDERVTYEVQRRTHEALSGDGEHDRRVQNEIARGFFQGKVVDAVAAEQLAVSTAFGEAMSSVLGHLAKNGREL